MQAEKIKTRPDKCFLGKVLIVTMFLANISTKSYGNDKSISERYDNLNRADYTENFIELKETSLNELVSNYELNSIPTASIAVSQLYYCGVLVSGPLGGNIPVSGTGTWSKVSGTGAATFDNPNNGNSTVTVSAFGTYVFRWTIIDETGSSSSDVTVKFERTATITPGTFNICGLYYTGTIGVSTSACGGTGSWSKVSGPGTVTFNNPSSNSVITVGTYGTYVVRWTLTNGSCVSSADQILTFAERADIPLAQMNVCGTFTSQSLGANNPSAGVGAWSQVSGPGTVTFSNSQNGASTATVNQYGNYQFRWTITNGTCSTYDNINVSYYQTPSTAIVSQSELIACGTTTSLPLGGNTPAVGTGLWTRVSGPNISFNNAASGNSTAVASTYGLSVLRWTISNGSCASSSADVTVKFERPASITPTTFNFCGAYISGTIGVATSACGGTGSWSKVSGPGTVSFNNPSNNSKITVGAYGTYVARWTLTNGSCVSSADQTLTYAERADIPLSQMKICGALTSPSLGANNPSAGVGTWNQIGGPGTVTFSDLQNGASTATVSQYGEYKFRWTITNGVCYTYDDIIVYYYQTPSTATISQSELMVCGPNESAPLGENVPAAGTGMWSQVSGPTVTFNAKSSGITTVRSSSYGTSVLRWTVSSGTCPSNSSDISVKFEQLAKITRYDRNFCGLNAGNFTAIASACGGTGTWSQVSGPGTVNFSNINSTSTNVSVSAYGTYVIRWTLSNGSCTTTEDATLTFTEPANIPLAQIIACGSLTSQSLGANNPTVGTGTWSTISGPGSAVFSDINDGSSTAVVSTYGVYKFRWTIVMGSCSTYDDIDVIYTPLADIPYDTLNYCGTLVSNSSLYANKPSIGSQYWSSIQNINFNGSELSDKPTVTASTYGTYKLRWNLSTTGCTSYDEVVLNFFPSLASGNVGNAQIICYNTPPNSLMPISQNIGGSGKYLYQWQSSIDNLSWIDIVDAKNSSYTPDSLKASTYFRRITSSSVCPSSYSNIVTLTVNSKPTITSNITNTTVCEGSNATFSITANGTDIQYKWYTRVNTQSQWELISTPSTPTYTVSVADASMNGSQFYCEVSGACTPSVQSEIATLTVNQNPSITQQPESNVVCEGGATTFTVVAQGTAINYKWKQKAISDSDWSYITGAESATYSISETTASMNGTQYLCEVTGLCAPLTVSNVVTLTVNSKPIITSNIANTTVCEGSGASFSVTANGTDLQYKWYSRVNAQSQWVLISTPSTPTYTISIADASMNGNQFYCDVSGACAPSIKSDSVTLTVNLKPVITQQPTSIAVCNRSAATFTAAATGTDLHYKWKIKTPSDADWNDILGEEQNTYTISDVFPSMNGIKIMCDVSGYCTPSVITDSIILTVKPTPTITVQPINARICEESNFNFSIIASGLGLSYQWEQRANDNSAWEIVPDAILNTYTGTATPEMDGYQFHCKVNGDCLPTAIVSETARIVVCEGGKPSYSGRYNNPDMLPKNWTETIVYKGDGTTVVGHSRSYADWLGRGIQTQSEGLTSGRTIISQVVYDDLGRQVISTLPAAVINPGMGFKPNFFTNLEGKDYTSANFDGLKINKPDKVNSSIDEALGWYYSADNTAERYVPESSYPYSRVEYSNITGQVRRSAGAGEAYHMGSNHENYGFSMPAVAEELGAFRINVLNFPSTALSKSISVDAEGKQVVVFTDAQGKTIASGRVGGGSNISVDGTLSKDQGYLDVHLGANCADKLWLPSGYTFTIRNLLTEGDPIVVNGSNAIISIPAGFYRVSTSTTTDLVIGYDVNYSDLSFNGYDRAGKLVESYSPLAVKNNNPALKTTCKYNSLGWLLETNDYEQGISRFVYRKDGSIRFSQNAKQAQGVQYYPPPGPGYTTPINQNAFSYTNYDEYNRPVESGEYRGSIVFSPEMDPETPMVYDPNQLGAPPCLFERTYTYYDLPDADLSSIISGYTQNFTVGRVSKTWNDNTTTWYSYSYDGRVEWVVRKIANINKVITVDYTYDFNGNVTNVAYQKDNTSERFDHIYTYDADLRLSTVKTKTPSQTEPELQATYYYYAHGPLKRVEYGTNLQGVDYTYTLTGALKAINDPLISAVDPGQDGYAGTHSTFGKDLFGMALDYYSGDYTSKDVSFGSVSGNDRYDGQITSQRWRTATTQVVLPVGEDAWAYNYAYDSRNYLAAANFGTYNKTTGAIATHDPFSEKGITYDANGNIEKLVRFHGTAEMDNLTYNYSISGKPNQLGSVSDPMDDNSVGAIPKNGCSFTYNEIGQMTSRTEGGVTEYFKYNPYGLTEGIYTADDYLETHAKVRFTYDDNGFRVWKKDYSGTAQKETFYARDASGNILATYEKTK